MDPAGQLRQQLLIARTC